MVEIKKLKIYGVKHSSLCQPVYIVAQGVNDAIKTFSDYYKDDFGIDSEGIESIELVYTQNVIFKN